MLNAAPPALAVSNDQSFYGGVGDAWNGWESRRLFNRPVAMWTSADWDRFRAMMLAMIVSITNTNNANSKKIRLTVANDKAHAYLANSGWDDQNGQPSTVAGLRENGSLEK